MAEAGKKGRDLENPSKRRAWAVFFLVLFVLFLASPVLAESKTVLVVAITIHPGSLTIVPNARHITVPLVLLDGEAQDLRATGAPTYTIVDARGSGAGWNVTLSCSDFTDGRGHTLSAAHFRFTTGESLIMRVGGQLPDPFGGPRETTLTSAPLHIPQKVLTASAGFGKGTYTYSPKASNFVLSIPPETASGHYSATLTEAICSGP